MDDNSLEEFNVKDKVNFFVDAARRQVIHCKFNAIYHIVVLPFALHQNAPILICVRFSNLLSELLAQLIACLLTAAVGWNNAFSVVTMSIMQTACEFLTSAFSHVTCYLGLQRQACNFVIFVLLQNT